MRHSCPKIPLAEESPKDRVKGPGHEERDAKRMKQLKPMRFRVLVEAGQIPLDYAKDRYWVTIRMPFDPVEVWPERKHMRVLGTINGFPFRTSLFGSRTAGYLMMINQTMQKKAKAVPGSMAELVIEPDLEDRSATPPQELAKLLKADREVKKWFEKLNYSMRKYICDRVDEPKSAETRVRRAEQWVECLMLAMEGEIEPPPVLQAIFRRQPQARAAWDAQTPIQRRNQLLQIFQAQSPEARLRRAEWAVTRALGGPNSKPASKRSLDEEEYG
jgi:uncharacterized protein YdeI (YjbR/CyaY-like superfamily)